MKHTDVVSAAKQIGFSYHEDTSGHYLLIAPGVRISGVVGGEASSGMYSSGVSAHNELRLQTQVFVDLLSGKDPKEMIERDCNEARISFIKKIAY